MRLSNKNIANSKKPLARNFLVKDPRTTSGPLLVDHTAVSDKRHFKQPKFNDQNDQNLAISHRARKHLN